MIPPSDPHEKLERAVHQVLRQLPPRRAPASLEGRVRATMERRAALPWWRKSFGHWPLAARAVFLLLCLAGVKGVLTGSDWLLGGVNVEPYRAELAARLGWIEAIGSALRAIVSSIELALGYLPPLWIYGTLAFFATMYVALFGLGAAAYKALHLRR